jgi:glycosyltransferase 2 family protein
VSSEIAETVEAIEAEETPRRSPLRNALGIFLKLGIVAAILIYLISSRSLEFHKFKTLLHGWHWVLAGLMLMLPCYFLGALRYHLLLGALGLPSTYSKALSWTMIGAFYDIAMPFSGGGDLVKGWYVAQHVGKGNRSLGLLSGIVDRIIGMFSLIVFALIVCIFAGRMIIDNDELLKLSEIMLGASLISIIGFMAFSSEKLESSPLRQKLMRLLPFHARIESVYTGFSGLRHHKDTLLMLIGISLVSHMLLCVSILVMGNALVFTSTTTGAAMPLETLSAMVVLPFGLFLNTFGVAGGFGAGELAFEKLFSIIMKIKGGAELAFVFHVVAIFSRVISVPYVLQYKHSVHEPVKEAAPVASIGGN